MTSTHRVKLIMTGTVALSAALAHVKITRSRPKRLGRSLLASETEHFNYTDIENDLAKGKFGNPIASGTSSKIYNMGNGNALKKVLIPSQINRDDLKAIVREIIFSKYLKQDNLVPINQTLLPEIQEMRKLTKTGCFMVMPLAQCDLEDMLYDFKPISEGDIKSWMFSILEAVAYLHSAGIAHRDLKLSNCLFNGKEVMVCDFDLTKVLKHASNGKGAASNESDNTICGTDYAMAPEMFTGGSYTLKVDLWQVGCAMSKIYARKLFYDADCNQGMKKEDWTAAMQKLLPSYSVFNRTTTDLEKFESIVEAKGKGTCNGKLRARKGLLRNLIVESLGTKHYKLRADATKKARTLLDLKNESSPLDLLAKLLDYNPDTRYTAEQALLHPFFADERDSLSELRGEDYKIPGCGQAMADELSGMEPKIKEVLGSGADVGTILSQAVDWKPSCKQR